MTSIEDNLPTRRSPRRLGAAEVMRRLPSLVQEEFGALRPRLLLAQALAGLMPPLVGNRTRVFALRAAGFRIGWGTLMYGLPTVIGPGDLTQKLTIGRFCLFNTGCHFDLGGTITIGERVGVGPNVTFVTSSHDLGPASQRAGKLVVKPIVVEHGAWIGAACTILPGVTIGAGSVIGAGMVVSKSVPPNTLLSGQQKLSLERWG
jgi:maltose O-acetyltransferase